MSDKLKKSILIIVLIAVNAVLIIVTSNSVIKTISHVFKTGGVSVSDEGETTIENNEENIIDEDAGTNNDTNINEDEIMQDDSEVEINIENVVNGVKIILNSEVIIDYIEYSLDDGEKQKIEVGEKTHERIINVPRGEHLLKIEVVDINGMKGQREENVIGDTEPTLTIQSKLVNGKATFVIDAEDDENIKTITIIHNGGEQQIINVNEKTYHHEVIMTEGEINTIIVTATNINGLPKTRRVKFENK